MGAILCCRHMATAAQAPVGAILAGGAARRMGGAKMTARLSGRPLICWPVEALRTVLDEVVVVAKRDTGLPTLEVPVWIEPDVPRHPRAGIVHALREAGGRTVLVCAGDMPFVTSAVVSLLLAVPPGRSAVPFAAGRLQPLLARYEPSALAVLESAPVAEALVDTVRALRPQVLSMERADRSFVNVNTPDDLGRALRR